MSPLNTLVQHSVEYSRLNSFDILLSLDDNTLFEDDEDLVVHTGAKGSGFLTDFSLSPVKHDKSMDHWFDVKLSSNLSRLISPVKEEENDGLAEGVSNLISPEKQELEELGGLAQYGLLDLLIGHLEVLYERVESLEAHVHRLESMQQSRRYSGISSVTCDPVLDENKVRKKRSLIKQMFRLRYLKGKSVAKNPNRAEV